MLAQAARIAGYQPLVVDVCGDLDTCRYAKDNLRALSLDEDHLIPAIRNFIERYPVSCVVYGSGFEHHPNSLKAIANILPVLGNGVDVSQMFKNRYIFFAKLKALEIVFPNVAFCPPMRDADWLFKPILSHGGMGITRFNDAHQAADRAGYWQVYQKGMPHSVLFVANGSQYQIIGFNRQWMIALDSQNEFIFSGVINTTDLTTQQKQSIARWVGKLVVEFSLKGLNSLDFIQDGENSYFLEINSRPPASMQLYDADLFKRHLLACAGELTCLQEVEPDITAYQIVYATETIAIPPNFNWPEGVMDLPVSGSLINTGQPICSIIAHGKAQLAVLEQIQQIQKATMQQLNRFKSYGI